jgi:hypothetical protein
MGACKRIKEGEQTNLSPKTRRNSVAASHTQNKGVFEDSSTRFAFSGAQQLGVIVFV